MHRVNTRTEALAAHQRNDLVTAERLYRALLSSTPSDAQLLHYMGVLYQQTGRSAESIAWLRDALTLVPSSLPTLQLLIRACDETGDTHSALRGLDHYLAQRPTDSATLGVKGQQLVRLGRLHEAEPIFQRAAELSGNAALYHDLGLCRQLLGNPAGAAVAYHEAIQRGHTDHRTRLRLAQCLRATGRIKEYYETITDAARAAADDIELLIEAQSARRYVCDWRSFEENQPRLLAGLRHALETKSDHDIPPGILNYLEVDEATIAAIARRYAEHLSAAGAALRTKLPAQKPSDRRTTIRLGYLSTDFFAHAVGSLVRDLFACHDRTHFEVYGYSLRHQPDAVQTCIEQGCDTYRTLSGRGAEEIARIIAEDQIDILIDLAGYTSAAQPAVLAARPAPVQIAWLGYLGTSGGDFIDYIIADDIVLPAELAKHYTERVIRLPHFLVTSPLPVAAQIPSRQDVGLSDKGFIFCSFNQPYKLDRTTFGAWMEILRRAPGSVLWLYAPDTEVCGQNLHREAARLNVDPGRLVFAQRAPMAEHVARMALADLSLDPFHISGGATSVATLYADVPVLTLRGNSFLARMGSSINASLDLDDLDCLDREDYIAKAVALATNPADLAAAKDKLRGAVRDAGGFFDTRAFARRLEDALQTAWDRHIAGQAPTDIRTQ